MIVRAVKVALESAVFDDLVLLEAHLHRTHMDIGSPSTQMSCGVAPSADFRPRPGSRR